MKSTLVILVSIALTHLSLNISAEINTKKTPLYSIDTGYTITKVRTAQVHNKEYILASSYEGKILLIDLNGQIKWEHPLSGYMNHDVWAGDITGDGNDEIFTANADGSIYALNIKGELLWQFKANDAPMNAVTSIKHKGQHYVVAGGYDTNLYYLNSLGKLIAKIPSQSYSKIRLPKKSDKPLPPAKAHSINFIRVANKGQENQSLVVHTTNNSMQTPGDIYFMHPLSSTVIKHIKGIHKKAIGELRIVDINNDSIDEVLMGTSTNIKDLSTILLNQSTGHQNKFDFNTLRKQFDKNGYRVAQSEHIKINGENKIVTLIGSRLVLMTSELTHAEVLATEHSYYDLWKTTEGEKLILASAQSGGSAIHIIDVTNSKWKKSYEQLKPEGKLKELKSNSKQLITQLERFEKPSWEKSSRPVYFLTESKKDTFTKNKITYLAKKYPANPIFLNSKHIRDVEKWDRRTLNNPVYENKRDRRKKYTRTQSQVLNEFGALYKGNSPGAAFWGGHGNDPNFYSLETHTKLIDQGGDKKTVLIFPELEKSDSNFAKVLNDLIFPLAQYAKGKNAHIFIRTKHTFWQAYIYLPLWSKLLSGEFADVFIPSMEETTDKSMELSIAGRMGIWAAGSVNQWGARSARDNPSFDRTRQFSHQMLPNHFLRQMVYSISSGATQINNFSVDQVYMSVLWELIAKGAVYVPKREELLHLSPVHLSIVPPDERYLNEGHNVKWTSFYDEESEFKNPMVFSRLNGSWPGAANTSWDFSRYAAGVNERRQNFLPPYQYGLVLITPPQENADKYPRGHLRDNLHPIYKNSMVEYLSDGRDYISSDYKQRFKADDFYKVIQQDIKDKSKLMPLTVEGNVAWTLAQTSPTHLRLTLIDSGYLNPSSKNAKIIFHKAKPLLITDLLSKEKLNLSPSKDITISVPTGLFRFIDIELGAAL